MLAAQQHEPLARHGRVGLRDHVAGRVADELRRGLGDRLALGTVGAIAVDPLRPTELLDLGAPGTQTDLWARVRQGDMWRADWSGFDMVYLFQRPESMARAVAKAAELRTGAWLVSLEFEATQLIPAASYRAPGGKMVWLYRAPLVRVGGAPES